MLFGLVAALGAFLVVVWIVYSTAERPDDAVPDRGVRWDALNTGAIEDEVGRKLGFGASDATLADLARHHAFDMSARGFAGEQSPEGEDHAARRRRLAGRFVGTSAEHRVLFAREPGAREEAIGAQAADRLASAGLDDVGETGGIGAAAEDGRCAVVVVVGRRVATLDERPITGVAAGLWTLRGSTVDGVASGDLAVESRIEGGPWQTQGSSRPVENQLGDQDPRAFEVEVDVPVDGGRFEVRLLHDGDEVLRVPVRD